MSTTPMSPGKAPTFAKALPWLLTIGGIIGIICSLFLVYDQIKIYQNPNYVPACSLNPIVSCGSVINSKQGEVFGIPAVFLGMLAFPALMTIGLAQLAGAKFKRWFWLGLEAGAVGGFFFALWLFLLSLYRVHALCPFCLTVDVVVYALVWYITLHNIQTGIIVIPKRLRRLTDFVVRHHLDILILWFVVVFLWILHHFWYYYGQHL